MKPLVSLLSLIALFATGLTTQAQVTAPTAKKSGMESRLEQALKLYPDADTDKDGTLSINEALVYLETHPDLRDKLRAKSGGGGSSSQPASFAPGAKGTRVFVCAYSYMIFTAGMLPAVAKSAGLSHLEAGRQMIGGSQVIQHWNLPDEKNEAKKALRAGIVDVLTVSPNLLMPDPGIENFTKLGLETNPNLRVLVQSSWVPWDGQKSGFKNEQRNAVTVEQLQQMRDLHHNGWLKQLETQVNTLNASLSKPTLHIVPVSTAVYALRELVASGKAPGLTQQSQLFRDDHGHPSPPLALLVTYCHFAAIHQRSPVGLPVPASIQDLPQAEELNRVMQQIAWDAVTSYPLSGVKISDL